jgi:outer membrane protein
MRKFRLSIGLVKPTLTLAPRARQISTSAGLGAKRQSSMVSRLLLVLLCCGSAAPIAARDLTLDEALNIALNKTMRGEMIDGNLDVAQQLYSARRINMYLPEISLQGALPSYRKSEAYEELRLGEFGWSKRRYYDYTSFVELKQTLITGGSLTAIADLASENRRYPYQSSNELFQDQFTKSGELRLSLAQPLFRPSSVKNELNNRKDDLEIARVTRVEQVATLKRETTEAYLGTIQLALKADIAARKLEQAKLKEGIDSAKLTDGVVSEEDYLLTSSARLDAELADHTAETDLGEKKRELATLLDMDAAESLDLTIPELPVHLDEPTRQQLVAGWEEAAPIYKASRTLEKAKREADYAAAGHGLTGDLAASYAFGQQDVQIDYSGLSTSNNYRTNNWTLALQVKLPLWDGGAGSAAVRAARYQAEQANYEFTRAQRSARAKIVNLINQLDVSYQRLDIIRKQIELADERLKIANGRFTDGRISRLTLLDSEVFLLETKDRYLEELKKYLVNRIDLESQYLS